MPRYEAIDPTQQGYWQVMDNKDRTGPSLTEVEKDGKTVKIQTYRGQTYGLAVFTPALTKAGISAEHEARVLAEKMERMPSTPPLGAGRFQATSTGEMRVYDSIREEVIAAYLMAHCPIAQQERDALVKRLNALPK